MDGSASMPDAECHFIAPVRFGRRKTDQVGHLVLSDTGIAFHGSVDLAVPWSDTLRVEHRDVHIVIVLKGRAKTLRFCCQTADDARRGAAIADHLAALAQSEPFQTA